MNTTPLATARSDDAEAVDAPISAQCPACGLHEIVPVHLYRGADGVWRQHAGKGPPPADAVVIDTCPVCFGAWFDRGELDTLGGDAGVDELLRTKGEVSTSDRPCPRGHGRMDSVLCPEVISTPLERCRACGGLWLDGEERRRLATASTSEGQGTRKERLAKRGVIWAVQLLTHLPVEVENPARGTPWIVYTLLGGYLFFFVAELQGLVFYRDWAVIAGKVVRETSSVHTLFTHQFLHGSWIHLLGNAYFLYIFGDNVEHLFGRLRFILLVVGGGLIGGTIHVFLTQATATPMIGASGAIAAVMAAYLWSFPRAKLFQTIPFLLIQVKIPAWIYLVIWLGLQFVMGFFTTQFEMAWFSHIGGFVYGLGLTPLVLWMRRREVARKVAVPAAHWARW
ncbi:MAG: rhomboid family intramembrane serine protease [Nannocystaceae bacterium]